MSGSVFQSSFLHHSYLLAGDLRAARALVLAELAARFGSEFGTSSNPDFLDIATTNWTINDSRLLKDWAARKPVEHAAKVALISAASYLREAQNSLLKTLEEPAPGTHFFLLAPQAGILLPTVISRCEMIKVTGEEFDFSAEAKEFLSADLPERYALSRKLLARQEEGEKIGAAFLNALLREYSVQIGPLILEPDYARGGAAIARAASLSIESGGSLRLLLEHLAGVVPIL